MTCASCLKISQTSMAELGFYRLIVPEDLGGLGVAPGLFCETLRNLGHRQRFRGVVHFHWRHVAVLIRCAATLATAENAAKPNVITSGVFADSGTAQYEERDGSPGYLINGHWRWGSGCRNAQWISGGIHESTPVAKKLLTCQD